MFRLTHRAMAAAALVALHAATLMPTYAGTMGSDDGDDFRTLSQQEGREVLENFRRYRQPGVTRLRFVITHAERHLDDDTRYVGELLNTWDAGGMITRIELNAEGAPATARKAFLIRGGKKPSVWTLGPTGQPIRADADALVPMTAGLVFTPYDLQLPFVHWADAQYRETKRFRTRPTDYFRLKPDPAFSSAHPEVAGVHLGFDRAYNALMRAETLDAKGKPMRDLRAESFGKIQGRWIVREMQLRDCRSRATDTLAVKTAALNLELLALLFTPEGLAEPLPETPPAAFSKAD
jgi:hypothetical protein